MRTGFVTSAAQTAASTFKVQEISRHRSLQVLAGSVRDAQVYYRDLAGSGFCKASTIADRRRCATGSRNVVVFRALNLSGGGLH